MIIGNWNGLTSHRSSIIANLLSRSMISILLLITLNLPISTTTSDQHPIYTKNEVCGKSSSECQKYQLLVWRFQPHSMVINQLPQSLQPSLSVNDLAIIMNQLPVSLQTSLIVNDDQQARTNNAQRCYTSGDNQVRNSHSRPSLVL